MSDPLAKNPPQAPTAAAQPQPAATPHVPAARFRQRAFRAGFTQLPNVVLTSQRLSPAAKLAYALLCYFAWQDDAAWPHQNALAAHFNGTEKTLRRALLQLKVLGLLTVERRRLGRTNVYWLEPLDTFAEEEADWQVQAPASTVETTATERSQSPATERSQSPATERSQSPATERSQSPVPLIGRKKTQGNEDTHSAPSATTAETVAGVCARLRELGFSPRLATKYVERHGAAACQQQIDWLPLHKPRDPVATLRRAIEEAWLPPVGNPKLRLPGEKPYVALAPPELPVIGPESDAAREAVKAKLARIGLATPAATSTATKGAPDGLVLP